MRYKGWMLADVCQTAETQLRFSLDLSETLDSYWCLLMRLESIHCFDVSMKVI